uniref:Uncharacterized protein n=1 Tax=Zea mays TaxID=4577 RepID=C0HIJ5_MAIZE|nr:unknown [Zea mays]
MSRNLPEGSVYICSIPVCRPTATHTLHEGEWGWYPKITGKQTGTKSRFHQIEGKSRFHRGFLFGYEPASLREISELAQDPDEARDGDALEQRIGLLLLPRGSGSSAAVEAGVPQPHLIPHLEPDQRHRPPRSFVTASASAADAPSSCTRAVARCAVLADATPVFWCWRGVGGSRCRAPGCHPPRRRHRSCCRQCELVCLLTEPLTIAS